MNVVQPFIIFLALSMIAACGTTPSGGQPDSGPEVSIQKREFNPMLNGRWIGNGISYGAYRDGEDPDNSVTSKAHILEDLQILSKRWNLIRLYGSGEQSRNIVEVIQEHQLPIRVMQGAWISSHQTDAENDEQVEGAIELANEFKDIVVAVNIGNEIFVDWSWHRIEDMDQVIEYIRDTRARVTQPVSVNDDYNFWNKPHAKRIADEVDFIGLHAYAFWNNKTIDIALEWTVSIFDDIQQRFPDHVIAYCETGWPTSRIYDDGSYEGGLIGKAGEKEQKIFFDQYNQWVEDNQVISLLFEAFDEKWKGGFDGENPMDKAEKHWGLYFSDRTPKLVIRELAE
ncbi:MAG: glycosyl hydrolase family 17 [Pseudomonadota bacterium]